MKFLRSPFRIIGLRLLSFLLLLSLIYSEAYAQQCILPKPTSLQVSAIQGCSVTFSWSAVLGASYYEVKFKKQGTSSWSPKINVGANTSYTFTGLSPSTKYTFSVAPYCSNNKSSGNRTISGTTAACTTPTVTSVQTISSTSVSISWEGCSSGLNQIRYKMVSVPQWTFVSTGSDQNIILSNLTTDSTYIFQLNACADTAGTWSVVDSFTLQADAARPNILLIILDDARFDSYSCNGAPSSIQTPNIDRIAGEGINFKNAYCVESYCIPSRGSIVTGLYPHKNGAIDNSSNIHSNLPTTATILNGAGYYTAWIGKYHMAVNPQPGYSYWFATKVNSGTDEYNNMKYNYNGTLKTVHGHDTDILTDTMLAFLDRNASKNFFATLAYHAPHNPFIPQDEFNGIFSGAPMPVPVDTAHEKINYPSFLYDLSSKYYITPNNVAGQYEKYFEMIAGVDAGIGKILQKLTDLGILDNTCIIFTSDNGFLLGEHGLFMKLFAYDPSSRVPMFIRYPAIFNDSTINTDQMALNVDIAPTILDIARIQGDFSFDGVSMKKLADHSTSRTSMYYEYTYISAVPNLPYFRAIQTLDSKLINYGCNQTTQEFFDMTKAAPEDTNRIFDPAYSSTIQSLSDQLTDFRIELADNITDALLHCFVKNISQKDLAAFDIDEENLPDIEDNISLFPDPAINQLNIAFSAAQESLDVSLYITDMLGKILQTEKINIVKGANLFELKLDDRLPAGCYTVTIVTSDVRVGKPFLIEK